MLVDRVKVLELMCDTLDALKVRYNVTRMQYPGYDNVNGHDDSTTYVELPEFNGSIALDLVEPDYVEPYVTYTFMSLIQVDIVNSTLVDLLLGNDLFHTITPVQTKDCTREMINKLRTLTTRDIWDAICKSDTSQPTVTAQLESTYFFIVDDSVREEVYNTDFNEVVDELYNRVATDPVSIYYKVETMCKKQPFEFRGNPYLMAIAWIAVQMMGNERYPSKFPAYDILYQRT